MFSDSSQCEPESTSGVLMVLGYRLVCTCGACPEQYDVFEDDKQVGYLRLRHGRFTVDVPDAGDEQIYEAFPRGDGIFDSDERNRYLEEACRAIRKHYQEKPCS